VRSRASGEVRFLKITKKKVVMTLIFPLAAILILFSGFILIDFVPSIILKIALVVTVIWWYILSSISVFLLEKRWNW